MISVQLVTGLLLALNMPPQIPLWMPVLGSAFAIIVVKQLFGGLGQNFMNPALGSKMLPDDFFYRKNDRFCSTDKLQWNHCWIPYTGATPLGRL